MQLTPMAPKCGVEVSGVSLAHCSDAEMEELFVARLDNLTADGFLGELMIEEFRNQGIFE